MEPTQPKHRHANRQSANGETEVGQGRGVHIQDRDGEEEPADGGVNDDWWLKVREKTTEWQGKKGRTEMSDKRMKGTSSKPQSGSESNTSFYYSSSVRR